MELRAAKLDKAERVGPVRVDEDEALEQPLHRREVLLLPGVPVEALEVELDHEDAEAPEGLSLCLC